MKKKPATTVTIESVPVRWLNMERACQYVGMSRDFFDNLTKTAQLSFSKVGHTIFFDKNDIDKLMIKNKVV